jgi:hypothetical protein
MACATSCKTQDHTSYGQCLRYQGLAVTGLESTSSSFTRERSRKFDAELDAYEAARKEGIQPEGTSMKAIDSAKKISDQSGTPYRADLA